MTKSMKLERFDSHLTLPESKRLQDCNVTDAVRSICNESMQIRNSYLAIAGNPKTDSKAKIDSRYDTQRNTRSDCDQPKYLYYLSRTSEKLTSSLAIRRSQSETNRVIDSHRPLQSERIRTIHNFVFIENTYTKEQISIGTRFRTRYCAPNWLSPNLVISPSDRQRPTRQSDRDYPTASITV